MQNILKNLLQHCAFGRIERELFPEKTAAAENHAQTVKDNIEKQRLIDDIVSTSQQLVLNE